MGNIIRKLHSIVLTKWKERFNSQDDRTKNVAKNAVVSLLVRTSNIIVQLLVVPLTINYLSAEKYGVWLSLSAVIGWVSFFNLGLGNGFRNRYAEALAGNKCELAKQYVSTTYFAVTCIVLVVWIASLVINSSIDWAQFLKISGDYKEELGIVFGIVVTFICLNMILNNISYLLMADQRNGLAAIIGGIGQWISLLVLFILTKTTNGSLVNLATYYSGIPSIVLLIATFIIFGLEKYKEFRPSVKAINISLIKDILTLGIRFFIINLCVIFVFQIINIVISREIGPVAVTQYNVVSKYFNVVYMVVTIVVTPIWSAVTDAYAREDFAWMKKTERIMNRFFILSIVAYLLLLLFSPIAYRLWVGDSVSIPYSLSVAMCFYMIAHTLAAVYINIINGTGAVRIQMIAYIILAFISWPMYTYSSRAFGLVGAVAIPAIACLFLGIVMKIQVGKIVNGTAKGLWLK